MFPSGCLVSTKIGLWYIVASSLLLAIVPGTIQAKDLKKREVTLRDEFDSTMLEYHNTYREAHGVPVLTWDERLAKFAREFCRILSLNNTFVHSGRKGFGENVYRSTTTRTYRDSAVLKKAKRSVKKWYKESAFYNYDNPGFNKEYGHFTQVVWKATTGLGCGYAFTEKRFYVCCNYSPPANYARKFSENVLPSK